LKSSQVAQAGTEIPMSRTPPLQMLRTPRKSGPKTTSTSSECWSVFLLYLKRSRGKRNLSRKN
jgi:hypothetical protein